MEKQEKLLAIFFESEEGKRISDKNIKKTEEEFKTKTGWFSPEEDKAWEYLNKEE